jgi:oligopeptide transport system substrate-binding protein
VHWEQNRKEKTMKRTLFPLMNLLIALFLLLGTVGCQPLLVALGEGPIAEPTATATWPPPATATPTIVPPTMPAYPTATATSTLTPTLRPKPFPTPTVTPMPEIGYCGNPAIGFSFFYPSEWEAEETSRGLRIWNNDLGVRMWGESSLMDEGETVDDYIAEMYDLVGDVDAVQVIADTMTLLWDGAEARVIEFAEPDGPIKARATLRTRGRRVFLILIVAPKATFDDYPRTMEAIAASLRVEEPRPYGISRQNALFRWGSQPHTIDPALTHGGAGGWIGAIFSGLVTLDENLQVVPDLAESWEIGEDGTVYTFYLRRNATFHDGKPVTAHDVKFSWERAADPDTESDTVGTYLGDIVGLKAKSRGEADEISGVEVVDDYTLRVTIDAPKVYFLAKLTYPTSFVVDEENVQDENWEHHPNGTGPFRLLTWEDDRLFILERNEDFYLEPAKLEHIVYMLYAGVPMWMYENDEIDLTGVGTSNIERVTDPANPLNADLYIVPALCTSRLIFDVTMPPFDEPLVRQAFAYAIDRQKLSEVVLKGMDKPAYTILPPGMPGYSEDITAPKFNPDRAQEFLVASSYGSADALPEITLTISGRGGGLSGYYSALIDMWRTHLGVEVIVEQLEPTSYVYEVREHHGQIMSLGWCADYPDPENFLDVLYHSEGQQNVGHYSNPEVDEFLKQARTETDIEARMALYHQIEQMIVDDTPDILLDHGQDYFLLKPYVKNYPLTPIYLALTWHVVSIERPTE